MNPIQNISIPSACHELWNNMLPAEGGRHCGQCCKTVVNFAAMTDNEIISYLASNKAVCGRFETSQLNNLDHKLYVDNLSASNWWKRVAIILGMMGLLAFKAGAVNKPLIVNTGDTTKKPELHNFTLGKIVAMPRPAGNRVIKGRIIAKDDSLPIPGVSIIIKGTSIGSVTDVTGKFTISVPAGYQTLAINEVGYYQQEIRLTDEPQQTCNVALVEHQYLTGEVVIVKQYSRTHRLWARTKRFFKRLF
jgi:hypothetical protein